MLPVSRVRVFCAAALCATLSLAGCGGESRPKTVRVTGKVTSDGKPVTGARIRFVPDAPSGRTAFGDPDAGGNFTLTTYEKGDGVIPGSYKVDVSPSSNETPGIDVKEKGAPKASFPEKYRDAKTSGLSYTLKGGETLDIKLD